MTRENIKTLTDLLIYIREAGADYPFMYRIGREIIRVSREQLYEDALHAGAVLSSMLKPKSTVALFGENSYAYIVSLFAAIISGNIPVLIDKMMDEDVLADVIAETECSAVIYSPDYEESLYGISADRISFEELLSGAPDSRLSEIVMPDEADICSMFLTSGSMGKPKIVPLTHKNIVSEFWALDGKLDLPEKAKAILCLPLHHSFGLICNVLYGISIGATIFITGSLRDFMMDIVLVKPDVLVLVPALYSMILRALKGNHTPEALRMVLGPDLKHIIIGGAPFSEDPSLMLEAGITPYLGFGLTETSACITLRRLSASKTDVNSAGAPIGNVEIIIGEDNEILVKGDMVFNSYFNSEAENENSFVDGYFRTGDVGYLDEKGELHVTGRIKNLIILPNGENISSEKLEAHVYALPYVKECIVKELNNKITAEIFSEDSEAAEARIKEDLRKINVKLPVNCSITGYVFRNEPFPKTSTQKIKRY